MAKLLKLFIALMALASVTPFTLMAETLTETKFNLEDTEDFDLKNLEDELRRLLEEVQEDTISSEEDTLVINPSIDGDNAKKLEIEYKEPMIDAFKQEVKVQPMDAKEEIIILNDEDNYDDLVDEDEEEELY